MIELEKEFKGKAEVSDYSFKMIASNGTAYVYEISDEFNNRHYEAFERKEAKKHDTVIAGIAIHYNARVLYPKSNDFGVTAWCFKSLESAMNKFNQITNENLIKPYIQSVFVEG